LKSGNRGLYFVGLAIGARWGRGGFRQNGIVVEIEIIARKCSIPDRNEHEVVKYCYLILWDLMN